MPTLDDYMARYDHEHTTVGNKVLHGLGIPFIFAGTILLILTWWRLGLGLFVFGWAMLFLGHRFEGNKPAFFQGPVYFLICSAAAAAPKFRDRTRLRREIH